MKLLNMKNNNLRSLLILSTGRTGTKYLAKTLKKIIPNADVYHEAGERSRWINILSHAHQAGLVPAKLPLLAWQKIILPDLQRAQTSKDFYIDANNHIYLFAVNNPELYPNLRVVHIIRDPREYVRSHVNWSRTRLKSFIANNLVPFWQPTGYFLGDIPFFSWVRMSQIERFAWVWKFKNLYINRLAELGIPYLRLKFEDLFLSADSVDVFHRMLAFFEVDIPDNLRDYIDEPINVSKQRLQSWMEWPVSTCRRIDQLCGSEMREYGYGSEPEWLMKVSSGAVQG